MRKMLFVLTLAAGCLLMSCEGNGPKPKVIIKGQSIEEINNAVVDDGWIDRKSVV